MSNWIKEVFQTEKPIIARFTCGLCQETPIMIERKAWNGSMTWQKKT